MRFEEIVKYILLPIITLSACVYGFISPLKAKGSMKFPIKRFYKNEQTEIYFKRVYALIMFVLGLGYSVLSVLILLKIFDLKINSLWLFLVVLFGPLPITYVIHIIRFNKEGK